MCVILCSGFSAHLFAQDETKGLVKNLSIGISMYESSSGSLSAIEIQKALERSLFNYYRLNIQILTFDNHNEMMDQIDIEAEQFVKRFLKDKNLDYFIYIRNRRNIELWLEAWNKDGILENIGIPFSNKIETELVDIAANLFLSIIENLDNRLYKVKQF
jgi:hypothetical protein